MAGDSRKSENSFPKEMEEQSEVPSTQSDLLITVTRIREARNRDYMASDGQSDGGGTGRSDGPAA